MVPSGQALCASHRAGSIATAVALRDLDRFQELERSASGTREATGALLASVRALEGAPRRGDLPSAGRDEFAALLAVRNEREALSAAHRMRDAVAASEAGVTVSVGVAISGPEEGDDSLVGRADRALYAAKRDGRYGVALDPGP